MLTLYTVVDSQNGFTKGKYVKRTSAYKRADKLNFEYGAHRYNVVAEILNQEVKLENKGLTRVK
jgi:hypothetical protein